MKKLCLALLVPVLNGCACYIVDPGNRGVHVSLGEVSPTLLPEGSGAKAPWSNVEEVSIRQQTQALSAECFSSDLQQVNMHVKVLFRVPEESVIKVFKDYSGNPFDSLVAPRVQEALKEVTAGKSAEHIVKAREEIKNHALALAKLKVGDLLFIEDVVIEDIQLSAELKHAIESKMVQEQEASKAKFIQQKAEIEAATAVVRAEGEAKAIRIRGQALRETPGFIDLQIVEKWDGKSPLVVGAGTGANVLLPMADVRK